MNIELPERKRFEGDEDYLYRVSKSFKFKAREMRKRRVEDAEMARARSERAERERLAKAAEKAKADELAYKKDLDDRIRKVMLAFMASLKQHQLAYETPVSFNPVAPAFGIIDQEYGKGHRTVKIRSVEGRGFEWD